MGSIIKSVSLDYVESEFLEDYNLSPTKLLKEKIWEMRGAVKKLVADKIGRMANVIQEQSARIEDLENELRQDS